MALGLLQTKNRIKSVQSTSKITKAMELVATSKLKKAKDINKQVSPFIVAVNDAMAYTASKIDDKQNIYFNNSKNKEPKLYIVVTSSLGLCGGYDINVFKNAISVIDKEKDSLIVIGSKGINYFKGLNYKVIEEYELPGLGVKDNLSTILASKLMSLYDTLEYKSINIIYTRFINSLTYNPTVKQLLPLEKMECKLSNKEIQIEPSPEEILRGLVEFYSNSNMKALILESMLCEQASRRMAMENATDNANEILDKLLLEYNKSRQASITQEITEISAANNND